jgi:hypothetical protein
MIQRQKPLLRATVNRRLAGPTLCSRGRITESKLTRAAQLAGKKAVITGADSGIGRAVAIA